MYHLCIFLTCQSKKLSVAYIDRNYLGESFYEFLGIGIPDLLMNLFSCHGFMKNIKFTVVFLCPSQMLKYYCSKGFVMFERN